MTREEAEKLTKDAWPKVSVGNNYGGLQQGSALGGLSSGMAYAPMSPSAFVELATALGILKLDEPKSAAEKLSEKLDGAGYSTGDINSSFDCVARANVKIVSK